MNRFTRQRSLLSFQVLACTLLAGASALAQPAAPQPTALPVTQPRPMPVPQQAIQGPFGISRADLAERLIDIDFPGGTVAEYITAVRSVAAFPINIVASPEIAATRIGPIQLRSAVGSVVVGAIPTVQIDASERGQITFQSIANSGIGADSYMLGFSQSPFFQRVPSTSVQSERIDLVSTYPISSLTTAPSNDEGAKTIKQDDLTRAVEAVLRLASSSEPATILVHAETGLLVVQGTSDQHRLTGEVLSQLRTELDQKRSIERERTEAARRSKEVLSKRDDRIRYLEVQIQDAQSRIAKLRQRAETIRKDVLENSARETMLNDLDLQLISAKDDVYNGEQILRIERFLPASHFDPASDVVALRQAVTELRREVEAFKVSNSGKKTP